MNTIEIMYAVTYQLPEDYDDETHNNIRYRYLDVSGTDQLDDVLKLLINSHAVYIDVVYLNKR